MEHERVKQIESRGGGTCAEMIDVASAIARGYIRT